MVSSIFMFGQHHQELILSIIITLQSYLMPINSDF